MKENTHSNILFAFFIFSLFILVSTILFSQLEPAPFNNEQITDFNEGWQYTATDGTVQTVTLPSDISALSSSIPTIVSNTLPAHFVSGMTLCIRTVQQTLRVSIDEKVIYEYGLKEKRLFGRSPGSGYHFVRLPFDLEGKSITLELDSPYTNYKNFISSITYGSKLSNVFHIIKTHLPSFILCVFICLSGLLLILIHLTTRNRINSNKTLFYLGLFAICVSVWSATETSILQILIGIQFVESVICFLSFMLCPFTFLLFLGSALPIRNSKLFQILCYLSIINFTVINLIQLSGIRDYLELIVTTNILILLVLLYTLYTVTKQMIRVKDSSSIILGVGFILLCILSGFDMIRFLLGPYNDCSLYFRIGIFIFIFLVGFNLCIQTLKMIELGVNAKTWEELAYVDILTHIPNRTAFDKDMLMYEDTLTPESNIIVMMFDLNYLKRTNDNYGHTAGDSMLIGAASCMKEALGNYGTCYRIGGDEFAAILRNPSDTIFEIIEKLKIAIDIYNKKNTIILDLAYGYATFDPDTDKNLFSAFVRADELMYQHKAEMKKLNQSELRKQNTLFTKTEESNK